VAIEIEHPRRLVTLQRDGADFVVCFYPEEIIVFCYNERTKMCGFLRWKIINDNAGSDIATIPAFKT
jgi:hypothetical protein